jgi:outer membrane protein assembly factor BamB
MKKLLIRQRPILIVSILVVIGPGSLRASANWPQWRGPDGQGIAFEKNLPAQWSPAKNLLWKTAIPGRGHSSPIVWGRQVFLTTSIEGPVVPGRKPYKHMIGTEEYVHPDWTGSDRRYLLKVISLDHDTGKILWQRTAYNGPVFDHRHRKNTYASATPATDGSYVYAFFGSEGLYCYDFGGGLVWKVSLGGIPQLGMGPGSSPVLYEDLVIVTADQDAGEGSFIVALEKKTGRQRWRVLRKARATWATPILVRTTERTELIVSGTETSISYDPATGREFWRCEGVASHAIPSPVAGHGMVFLSAGSRAKRALAIRTGGAGDLDGTPNIVWRYGKGTAYVPSPILYGDYLYLMTDAGLLTCMDARTGEVKYEGGRVPVPATFTASPVAFAGKILLTSEDGDTFVVEAGPSHRVLGTNSIGEPVYASPAIAAGKIFIRGEKHLFCIG